MLLIFFGVWGGHCITRTHAAPRSPNQPFPLDRANQTKPPTHRTHNKRPQTTGGKIAVYPSPEVIKQGFVPEENVVVGNVCLYGATRGKVRLRFIYMVDLHGYIMYI